MEAVLDKDEFWSIILSTLENETKSPKFNGLYGRVVPIELTEEKIILASPNTFHKNWLMKSISTIQDAVDSIMGHQVQVEIIVDESIVSEQIEAHAPTVNEIIADDIKKEEKIPRGMLDERYTFETFISGDSNLFARSMALAIAEKPGMKYNPLFISGGSGLGKTHLLQAIGNYVAEIYPNKKVVYATAEEFFTEFVNALSKDAKTNVKSMDKFHQVYRGADVLLMDDIQFLEGKDGGIAQFFHTFEQLYAKKSQIVIASDRTAAEINMDNRLITRFAMGLEVNILPPTYELRYAIIKRLFESQSLPVDTEVFEFLADKNVTSVREIEGAVNMIIAFSELTRLEKINLDVAKKTTTELFKNQQTKIIKVATIQSEVCKYFNISKTDLLGNKRNRSIVTPRHIAMYLTQELTDYSYPRIGKEFGGKDHTTVMHAVEKIKNMIKKDSQVYQQIEILTNQIKRQ